MTIYDIKKTPLSPFLIKMITLLYQAELGELSNFNLSNTNIFSPLCATHLWRLSARSPFLP